MRNTNFPAKRVLTEIIEQNTKYDAQNNQLSGDYYNIIELAVQRYYELNGWGTRTSTMERRLRELREDGTINYIIKKDEIVISFLKQEVL